MLSVNNVLCSVILFAKYTRTVVKHNVLAFYVPIRDNCVLFRSCIVRLKMRYILWTWTNRRSVHSMLSRVSVWLAHEKFYWRFLFLFCFYCYGRQSAEKPLRIITLPSLQRYSRSWNASSFFCLQTVKIIIIYQVGISVYLNALVDL